MKRIICTLLIALSLTGCSVMQMGYLPTKPDLSVLTINTTTYKQTISKFGTPATSQMILGQEIHTRYLFPTPGSKVDNIKIMQGDYKKGCVDCGTLSLSFGWGDSLDKSVLAAIGVKTPAMDKQHEEAMNHVMQGNFKEALPLLVELAEKNHTQSEYILGMIFLNGDGVTRDFSLAHDLFKNAAMKGHAKASYDLGVMYRNGEGVEPNLEMVKFCYEASANRNYLLAATELAKIYSKEGNIELATIWTKKAKEIERNKK